MEKKKTEKRDIKLVPPNSVKVDISLLPARTDHQDENGNYPFWVTMPGLGIPDFRILAKSEKEAMDAFMWYVYNELDGKDDIVADE